MTSEKSSPATRHLGRIVDPSAREDGGVDPVLEPAMSAASSTPPRSGASAVSTPHPVRDKLLARIREARDTPAEGGTTPQEREKDRFGSFGGLSEELERVARAPTSLPRRNRLRLGD
ncbi:MAG TPA: hypothetical protein VHO25_23505, partial [Polyangiaceae bacterium]|nr:hypothetical protein [Polyangiaceae bacterium]